jgi:hypothetical protein
MPTKVVAIPPIFFINRGKVGANSGNIGARGLKVGLLFFQPLPDHFK